MPIESGTVRPCDRAAEALDKIGDGTQKAADANSCMQRLKVLKGVKGPLVNWAHAWQACICGFHPSVAGVVTIVGDSVATVEPSSVFSHPNAHVALNGRF